YMPFVYQHPDYWHMIEEDTKGSGDMIRSRKLFDDSEAAHPLTEDEMIKVENIHGVLLLVGAEDDGLWNTCRYIRRMDERLKSRPHLCRYKVLTYKHGTHFVFPESLIRSLVPGSKFILGLCFRDAKRYPDACRRTRIDIDIKVSRLIQIWLREGK
ncbi:MAG: acyl-CoA thioester hydrolase/BAAT C-terminal domain-containing protein, partial [Candidatus Cryptobacteroides sp.]|nr:acyl-CoA thioester hydrolase/BAAT C-terminal domain-containing protein [Candidatus Cryptobacteroides sp.]